MKKTGLYIVLFSLLCVTAEAQFIKKLGNAVKNAAENATVRKAEQKTEQAVDKTIDKVTTPETYTEGEEPAEADATVSEQASTSETNKSAAGSKTAAAAAASTPESLEMVYAKSDFVPGDEIIFDDNGESEKMGEFPSMWDLERGVAEVVSINGAKAINIQNASTITPLMKDMGNYLPDVFTIELDFLVYGKEREVGNDKYEITFYEGSNKNVFQLSLRSLTYSEDEISMTWHWKTPAGESRNGKMDLNNIKFEAFHHLAISFNKRALKVYIDGSRVVNIPNAAKPARFIIHGYGSSDKAYFVKNTRIAKGAVPLYDRMMSDGKFITYGITFDVGKATIKPESMGEMNRIAELLKQNPDLKFSVEGHTDSTGNATSNQTLSDARSKAVVDKLVEMGIPAERLKSAGKGQNNPIADNASDEGRAKNRRVEFVKI